MVTHRPTYQFAQFEFAWELPIQTQCLDLWNWSNLQHSNGTFSSKATKKPMLLVLRVPNKPMLLVFRAPKKPMMQFLFPQNTTFVICEHFTDQTVKNHIAYINIHSNVKILWKMKLLWCEFLSLKFDWLTLTSHVKITAFSFIPERLNYRIIPF